MPPGPPTRLPWRATSPPRSTRSPPAPPCSSGARLFLRGWELGTCRFLGRRSALGEHAPGPHHALLLSPCSPLICYICSYKVTSKEAGFHTHPPTVVTYTPGEEEEAQSATGAPLPFQTFTIVESALAQVGGR